MRRCYERVGQVCWWHHSLVGSHRHYFELQQSLIADKSFLVGNMSDVYSILATRQSRIAHWSLHYIISHPSKVSLAGLWYERYHVALFSYCSIFLKAHLMAQQHISINIFQHLLLLFRQKKSLLSGSYLLVSNLLKYRLHSLHLDQTNPTSHHCMLCSPEDMYTCYHCLHHLSCFQFWLASPFRWDLDLLVYHRHVFRWSYSLQLVNCHQHHDSLQSYEVNFYLSRTSDWESTLCHLRVPSSRTYLYCQAR